MASLLAEILIVEDSRLQAKMLHDSLTAQGYGARVAFNGEQGLQMAREQRPDIVLCDIVMPVMDGHNMCAHFKSDTQLCNIPIVMLTALSDIEDVILGLQSRADHYLTKPYNVEFLFATLREVIENSAIAKCDQATEESAPLSIKIGGKMRVINANRRQILNLLLSTYGNAIEQNRTLRRAQTELQSLNDQLRVQSQRIEEQQRHLQVANAQLHALATHDGLTGLKNHNSFKERLDEEVAATVRTIEPLSLLMLDVDFFKQFNDTYGHPAGDDVLRVVAEILRHECRVTDFVARYGGEEFAILLPNTPRELALQLAERLRCAIEVQHWSLRAITTSIGAATFRDTSSTPDTAFALLEAADQALYHSKRNGRNRSTHSADIAEVAPE